MSRRTRKVVYARTALLAMLLTLLVAAPARAVDVFAPGSTPFGKTYGEWNAQWWTTMGQTLAGPGHPFATGQVKCSGTNDGRVIFLAGTTGGAATRSCKIPSSKAVLLPVVNFIASNLPELTDQELLDLAASVTDTTTNLQASVDGTAIPNLTAFRAPSPLFSFTLVANNTFGFPPEGPGRAAADGFYVMLKPLPRGAHTIVFGGDTGAFNFSTLATYNLTVVK
jgi:hypothetical protein